jgi:SulP family sulfate permease
MVIESLSGKGFLIVGAFFSGYATSGSFTRTGVNYEAGAKTPLAAVFAALFLALIVLLIAPLVKYIPIPGMAGILLLVSYNLIDFHHIKAIIRVSRTETAIALVTFLSTLFLELEFAIYMGVMLSLAIYLNRTSKPNFVNLIPNPNDPKRRLVNVARYELPEYPEVKIIRIDGSLFFGAVNYVTKRLQEIETPYLLIVGEGINFIDIAGAEMLVLEAERRRQLGGGLYFAAVKANALEMLYRGNYIKDIGEHTIFTSRTEAIKTIFRLQGKECEDLR